MRAAQTPTTQQRPRRPPLQELRLQSGAERTTLTPLLRRLRLKDHDCATPVSCTRAPPSSITSVPCTAGRPRSAILLPPSSTTLVPCTPGPPGTPTLGSSTLEPLGTPTLKPGAPETPSNPTLAPSALEPPSRTSPEPPGSPTPGPSTPEPPSSTVPAPLCSPVPAPSTPDASGSTVTAPQCSPVPEPSTPEPPSSTVPAPLCSPMLGSCTLEPPSSIVPATLCSPVPGLSTPEPSRSAVPAPMCSPMPGSCTSEPPSSTMPAPLCSSIPGPSTPEPPSSTMPAPLCSSVPGPSTPEPPSSTMPAPLCSSVPGPSTPESPSSTMPAPLCSPVPGPSTPEPPSSTVPAPLCSPVPGLSTPEHPGSTSPAPCTPGPPDIISSVPCTPNSPGSTPLAPCNPRSPGSASLASCTPGPPATSSTPQEAPFHGWRAAPADLSCSPVASEPLAGDGGAGSLPCQGTPEGAESPAPPQQGPPGLPPTEAGRSEPAGSEATATPIPSPEVAQGAVSWVLPLVWLEKSLNASSLLDSLRHSLPLPVPRQDIGTSVTPVPTAVAGTSVTPVPTAVAGTFMTPPDLRDKSMNTSAGGLPRPKDSAAETDSLLWHCPREQLKSLPRAELEGRLESTLIIIEALSLQLRDWQESQRPLPGVGPAEQRDALTQTDITHPKGEEEIYRNLYLELRRKTEALQRQRGAERDLQRELELAAAGTTAWSRQCLLFRGLVDAAFQSLQDEQGALAQEVSAQCSRAGPPLPLGVGRCWCCWHTRQLLAIPGASRCRLLSQQEQARALVSRCRAMLESVPGKLRSCLEERDAMRQQVDEALRAKEEGDRFLETFRAHASAQIGARDQSLASQRELSTLLADAIDQQASLAAEAQPFREFVDITFENLEEERRALDEEREQARALVSRCRAVLESVPGKLRSCLEERDAMRQRADEALQAKEEVSCQLEETSVALQDTVAQLEQLTVANSRLSADLSNLMTNLASLEQERDALQQENEEQWEEMAWLARERDTLQRECNGLCQELRESTECREFLDQENCMSRTQLLEVEARLKSTLATLQERSLQYEELMDSHQRLREEQAALGKELETTKAELLDLQLKRDKISWCSTDITESKMRLQELADCLRAALQEEDDDAPPRSRAWTPAPRTPGWQTPRRAWTPACRTPACRTPYHARASFVGSVLKAVSGKGELTLAIWVLGGGGVPVWGWGSLPAMLGMCTGAACGGDPSAIPVPFPADSPVALLWQPWVGSLLLRVSGVFSELPGVDGCMSELWSCSLQHAGLGTAPLHSPLSDVDEATGGGSVFTKDKPASTPKPIEPEDGLLESVKELRTVVSDLTMLSSRIQELEQSEFKALQTEISDLQLRLETVTAESQEKMDAQAATIVKLNKALRGKLENEKELQDVVKQQEEKMLQLIDKSGEVTRLKGEVSQLKRSLQRAETEAKVLWEEMRGQEPKVDAVYVQERVLLRQEVDKLRLLLLEKEDENLLLSDKYLEQVRGLELRLRHAQKVLRTHEEMQEKMKEVLSAVPDVAAGCQELHSLLRYLGLKPASGSKEVAEPL
ncbi:sperm-associated antigen 5 isoform 2-T2 [Morphnus guianensis]